MKKLGRPEELPSSIGHTAYFGGKLHALLSGKKEPSIEAREHWRALTKANRHDWLVHITIAALNSTRRTGGRSLAIAFDLSPELTAYVLPSFLRVAVRVRADPLTHGRAAYPKKDQARMANWNLVSERNEYTPEKAQRKSPTSFPAIS